MDSLFFTLIVLLILILSSISLRKKSKVPFREIVGLTGRIWISGFLMISVFALYVIIRRAFYFDGHGNSHLDIFGGAIFGLIYVIPNLLYEIAISIPSFIIYTLINYIIITQDYKNYLKKIIPVIAAVLTFFNYVIILTFESGGDIFSIWQVEKTKYILLIVVFCFTLSSIIWMNRQIKLKSFSN